MLWPRSSAAESTTWVVSGVADPVLFPIDPNGNLATKTEGSDNWTYTWNAQDQLTKVEKNGSEVARFAYDPSGRRVEKVAGGVTTSYAYDARNIVREVEGATTRKYIHSRRTDEVLAVDDGATTSYFHADGLGSVVRTTDAQGGITSARQYDVWGGLQVGAGQSGFAFTGREWDVATGLYYYRARYYAPEQGRFISEDPIGFKGGRNFYTYVSGNPATRTDPSGLQETCAYGCWDSICNYHRGCEEEGSTEKICACHCADAPGDTYSVCIEKCNDCHGAHKSAKAACECACSFVREDQKKGCRQACKLLPK